MLDAEFVVVVVGSVELAPAVVYLGVARVPAFASAGFGLLYGALGGFDLGAELEGEAYGLAEADGLGTVGLGLSVGVEGAEACCGDDDEDGVGGVSALSDVSHDDGYGVYDVVVGGYDDEGEYGGDYEAADDYGGEGALDFGAC